MLRWGIDYFFNPADPQDWIKLITTDQAGKIYIPVISNEPGTAHITLKIETSIGHEPLCDNIEVTFIKDTTPSPTPLKPNPTPIISTPTPTQSPVSTPSPILPPTPVCESIENGIWLCKDHARLIDRDAEHLTVEILKAWKKKCRTSCLAGGIAG